MGRSQESFNKKEVRNKKLKKKKDKEARREARKEKKKPKSFEDMIAYVDEFGNPTTTPPDPNEKKVEVDPEDIMISIPKKSEEDQPDPVRKGTVTHFNDSKGYGFIKDAVSQESVFVHINNVEGGDLAEGNLVSFETEMGPKGPTAIKVSISR